MVNFSSSIYFLLFGCVTCNQLLRRSRQLKRQTKRCTLLLKVSNFDGGKHAESIECELDGTYFNVSDNNNILKESKWESGRSMLNEAYFDPSDTKTLIIKSKDEVSIEENPSAERKLATTTGVKNILVLRAVSPDSETSSSEYEISTNWFGTFGASHPIFQTQINQCSRGLYQAAGANGSTFNGEIVTNGVYTVNIETFTVGNTEKNVYDAMLQEATTKLGDLGAQFHHVAFCVPPGTSGDWISYAYINWHISVFNDNWCNYVSAQLHEIGHNLNLAHSSSLSDTYGDTSSVMGYQWADFNSQTCFNAVKNWQLGWYKEFEQVVDPAVITGARIRLYGITRYDSIHNDSSIVTKATSVLIPNQDGMDIYLSFNLVEGMTSGSKMGINLVLLHSRETGSVQSYTTSTLLKELSSGDTDNTTALTIFVEDINIADGYADVRIGEVSPTTSPIASCGPLACSSCLDGKSCKQIGECIWSKGLCEFRSGYTSPTKAPIQASPTRIPETPPPTKLPNNIPSTQSPTEPFEFTPVPILTVAPNTAMPTTKPSIGIASSAPTKYPIMQELFCSNVSCNLCDSKKPCESNGCQWSKGICIQ